ncbi:hypothetical protein CEUSTIGMA_g7163.t1 [Chlamydomonas eustigma]|uniref:Protein kinase domain-containing protein n=1 Tax=Chlamydomonas eustigma TaxID=1157962 RepID=A0A250XA37_9CHLO|nr:hypothetical protein CEUSTIGMA_g7163.t1 [Chlamydomonas eustigma]|eukprot:GAX79722.1 hypothetical protein CEUSTIGMA_g7163.t1 [Chlamydomonas eustigma]
MDWLKKKLVHRSPSLSERQCDASSSANVVDATNETMQTTLITVLRSHSYSHTQLALNSYGLVERRPSLRAVLNLEQYDFVTDPTQPVSPRFSNASASPLPLRKSAVHDSTLVTAELAKAIREAGFSASSNHTAASSDGTRSGMTSPGGLHHMMHLVCGGRSNMSSAPSSPRAGLDSTSMFLKGLGDHIVGEAECNMFATGPDLPPAMMREWWSIHDFDIIRRIHSGYASDVYEAVCKMTKAKVALKVYSTPQLKDLSRVQLAREIRLHSKCKHVNVIRFYAAFVEDLPLNSAAEGEQASRQQTSSRSDKGSSVDLSTEEVESVRAIVIVVEWAGQGDLFSLIERCGGVLSEARAVNLVLCPLLNALDYLHSKGIVHRDLKPENMIFDEGMELKVADFGLAVDIMEERANTRAGTLEYMAPEVLLCPTKNSPGDFKYEEGTRQYHTGADAWAVGAVLYQLLTGRLPFHAQTPLKTANNIITCKLKFPKDTPVSENAQEFIIRCLNVDPSERPTVKEMITHPYVLEMKKRASFLANARRSNSFIDFLQRLKHYDTNGVEVAALLPEGLLYVDGTGLSVVRDDLREQAMSRGDRSSLADSDEEPGLLEFTPVHAL